MSTTSSITSKVNYLVCLSVPHCQLYIFVKFLQFFEFGSINYLFINAYNNNYLCKSLYISCVKHRFVVRKWERGQSWSVTLRYGLGALRHQVCTWLRPDNNHREIWEKQPNKKGAKSPFILKRYNDYFFIPEVASELSISWVTFFKIVQLPLATFKV